MIDLSADLGERTPDEEEIWPLISSANVACGGHIGDEESMTAAARRARELGVRFGAHPSYPDRANFGRRSMAITPEALCKSLVHQISVLRDVGAGEGAMLLHVKPHGALYNDAHRDRALAEVIIDAMRRVDPTLAIVCGERSELSAAARENGTHVIREAFADRRYEPDGSLTPRGTPGALLTIEEAAGQAALLASEGVVIARDGSRVPIAFDTLCIHADMEAAVERLRSIRARLGID